SYTATGDFANHAVRIDWERDQKYPDPPAKLKYSEVMTQKMGYVTDEKGSQAMSGIRLAAQTREMVRGSPILMLYALEHPDAVSSMPAQKLGDQTLPAIGLKVGQYNFTVLFDKKTKLPAPLRTPDDDNITRHSNY